MPQNGEINQQFGIYKTVCCGAEIVIKPGRAFPDCPKHPKLTTIWKPVVEVIVISQTANDSQPNPVTEEHIENRRLFNVAAGKLGLETLEQEHLHRCNLCQGVLHVFMQQPISAPTEKTKIRGCGLAPIDYSPGGKSIMIVVDADWYGCQAYSSPPCSCTISAHVVRFISSSSDLVKKLPRIPEDGSATPSSVIAN